MPEQFLVDRGLTNYWGYNTIVLCATSELLRRGASWSIGRRDHEFRAMVDALHAAGVEVILDVVFSHTAEGGAGGPTLCFRRLITTLLPAWSADLVATSTPGTAIR